MEKILVIDDTDFQREEATKQLSGIAEAVVVSSFAEAAQKLKTDKFDFVLTDLMMPGEGTGLGRNGKEEIGKPTPYGFAIAFLAMKMGVPKIAIVSNGQYDANHHNHPIFSACDSFTGKISDQLFVFAGYSCPTMKEERRGVEDPWNIKDWGFVLECLKKGEHREKPESDEVRAYGGE